MFPRSLSRVWSRHSVQKLDLLSIPGIKDLSRKKLCCTKSQKILHLFIIMRNVSFQAHPSSKVLSLVLRESTDKSECYLGRRPEHRMLNAVVGETVTRALRKSKDIHLFWNYTQPSDDQNAQVHLYSLRMNMYTLDHFSELLIPRLIRLCCNFFFCKCTFVMD